MAIIDSRVSINANIDHKVQSVASATCKYTACTHTIHAYVLHLHTQHTQCTCTANCPRQVRSIGSVACTGALTVDFKLRYFMCPAHTLYKGLATHAARTLHTRSLMHCACSCASTSGYRSAYSAYRKKPRPAGGVVVRAGLTDRCRSAPGPR